MHSTAAHEQMNPEMKYGLKERKRKQHRKEWESAIQTKDDRRKKEV